LSKKYELTNNKLQHFEFQLYQIRALKDIGRIKAGQLGGYVQGYHNLSQEGLSWIYPDCRCWLNGQVLDDAQARGGWIWNTAKLREEAVCQDDCFLFENVDCFGNCLIAGEACCSGTASKIYENAIIKDKASVRSTSWVHGQAQVYQFGICGGSTELTGTVRLRGNGALYEGYYDSGVIEVWSPYLANTALHG